MTTGDTGRLTCTKASGIVERNATYLGAVAFILAEKAQLWRLDVPIGPRVISAAQPLEGY